MPVLKRRTVQVGDVFQVLTAEGVCYGQVINTDAQYKFVIAIFRTFYSKEPKDFNGVVCAPPQLITTFLIQHAVRRGLFALVGHVPVAEHLKAFPIFKGTNNPKDDQPLWFFWDGERTARVDRPLTEQEKSYPRGPSLPSAPLLIEMIQNDYRVEREYG